jgi:hypothetical protein
MDLLDFQIQGPWIEDGMAGNTLVIGILTRLKYLIAELAPRQNGYGQDHFPDQLVWLTLHSSCSLIICVIAFR